uniref:uncharacterized protein LOC132685801 n=1 Tax=Panthera onca TaxID=9690 RepID=UPI002953E478|nr:uncharacterized protein LOC132685801 [Panthera onca]
MEVKGKDSSSPITLEFVRNANSQPYLRPAESENQLRKIGNPPKVMQLVLADLGAPAPSLTAAFPPPLPLTSPLPTEAILTNVPQHEAHTPSHTLSLLNSPRLSSPGYSPGRKKPSLEAGEFSLLEAVGFLVSCPVSGLSFAAFSPNQAGDGPAEPPAFLLHRHPDAPAGLRTVRGSAKPDPYLVPLHWGHTKASHPDSDNKSQLMFPVGPEEACLGQPRRASGGKGCPVQVDTPEEAMCVLSLLGEAKPVSSCCQAVLKVWSSDPQRHISWGLIRNMYYWAPPETCRIRTSGLGSQHFMFF